MFSQKNRRKHPQPTVDLTQEGVTLSTITSSSRSIGTPNSAFSVRSREASDDKHDHSDTLSRSRKRERSLSPKRSRKKDRSRSRSYSPMKPLPSSTATSSNVIENIDKLINQLFKAKGDKTSSEQILKKIEEILYFNINTERDFSKDSIAKIWKILENNGVKAQLIQPLLLDILKWITEGSIRNFNAIEILRFMSAYANMRLKWKDLSAEFVANLFIAVNNSLDTYRNLINIVSLLRTFSLLNVPSDFFDTQLKTKIINFVKTNLFKFSDIDLRQLLQASIDYDWLLNITWTFKGKEECFKHSILERFLREEKPPSSQVHLNTVDRLQKLSKEPFEVEGYTESGRFADIKYINKKVIIEVDGNTHHDEDGRLNLKSEYQTRLDNETGYDVIRIPANLDRYPAHIQDAVLAAILKEVGVPLTLHAYTGTTPNYSVSSFTAGSPSAYKPVSRSVTSLPYRTPSATATSSTILISRSVTPPTSSASSSSEPSRSITPSQLSRSTTPASASRSISSQSSTSAIPTSFTPPPPLLTSTCVTLFKKESNDAFPSTQNASAMMQSTQTHQDYSK